MFQDHVFQSRYYFDIWVSASTQYWHLLTSFGRLWVCLGNTSLVSSQHFEALLLTAALCPASVQLNMEQWAVKLSSSTSSSLHKFWEFSNAQLSNEIPSFRWLTSSSSRSMNWKIELSLDLILLFFSKRSFQRSLLTTVRRPSPSLCRWSRHSRDASRLFVLKSTTLWSLIGFLRVIATNNTW